MTTSTRMGMTALLLAGTVSAAVPEAQRQAELVERKKDMDEDLAALKKRLTRVPGNIDKFRAGMQKIRAAKGINDTGVVFGPPFATQALAENRKIADNCTTALIQFSRQLKERGVDLIVVPYIGQAEVYGHRLYEGGKPDDELWPAKVEGLIKLLENDVEVIECGDAFKAYTGKGSVLGHFDHHFGPAGIDIVARELGRRIRKRYDFGKAAEEGRKQFTAQEIQMGTPTFLLNFNGIGGDEAQALNIPPTIPAEQITYNGTVDLGTRIDPVFVMGDSSVPFAGLYPQGAGIMPHLSRELGRLVPYTSDSWGGHKQLEWYARSHATTLPQPRVLILIMTGYSLNWTPEFTVHPRVGGWNVVNLPPLPAAVPWPANWKADWPMAHDHLVFACRNGNNIANPILGFDSAGKPLSAPAINYGARRHLGPHYELILGGTPAEMPEVATFAADRIARAGELTILAGILPPAFGSSVSRRLVSLLAGNEPMFAIEQIGGDVNITVGDAWKEGPAKTYPMIVLSLRIPTALAVTAAGEWITVYVNGKGILRQQLRWTPTPLKDARLVLGDEVKQAAIDAPRLEAVAVYARALSLSEIIAESRRYNDEVTARPVIPRLRMKGKLLRMAPVPEAAKIEPSTQALVVGEYEVTDVLQGEFKEKTVNVAHWGLINRQPQPIAGRKAGEIFNLVVEPFEKQPQLEQEYRADTNRDPNGALYYDVEP